MRPLTKTSFLIDVHYTHVSAFPLCKELNFNPKLIKFKYLSVEGSAMKNSECTIYIMSKHGWLQKFRKEKDSWTLTSSNGTVRSCSAEQLLSHMLPILAGIKRRNFTVKVESDNITKI
jgi:hypothetical protein